MGATGTAWSVPSVPGITNLMVLINVPGINRLTTLDLLHLDWTTASTTP